MHLSNLKTPYNVTLVYIAAGGMNSPMASNKQVTHTSTDPFLHIYKMHT